VALGSWVTCELPVARSDSCEIRKVSISEDRRVAGFFLDSGVATVFLLDTRVDRCLGFLDALSYSTMLAKLRSFP